MKYVKTMLFILFLFQSFLFIQHGFGEEISSSDKNLTGIKEVKAYFDVTLADPAKLFAQLQIIDTTYNQLIASGYSPQFVLGIRGKASNFITKKDDYVFDRDIPLKRQISFKISQLKSKGVRIEECRIAADMQEIPVTDFVPQVDIVDNGYISLINYQSKGYSLVPIY